MKQLIFMIGVTLLGIGAPLLGRPFLGLTVYYLFAILRPQFLWEWSLPPDPGWSFFVALSTIACTILGLSKPSQDSLCKPSLSLAHYAMLGFGLWVCLTYFTAHSQETAYPFLVEYIKIFVMFFVAVRLLDTVSQCWTLYLLTAGALGYVAYEVNHIYLFQGGYLYLYQRGYCGLDNNGAGLMLAMAIPLCLFAWDGIQAWYRWIYLLVIPAALHAVLMSYSRGAMLSLLVTVPIYVFGARSRRQVIALIAGLALILPFLAGNEIRDRFYSIEDNEVDASANSRRTTWAIAWRMASENPLFGLGIRNSNLLTQAYGADIYGRTIHSQYLQLAADSGFVALGLYLFVLVTAWRSATKARKLAAGRDDVDARRAHAIACGVQGSISVFCFGSIFLSMETFELIYILLLLAMQLPLVHRTLHASSGDFASPATEHAVVPPAIASYAEHPLVAGRCTKVGD